MITIDADTIRRVDTWLDHTTAGHYRNEPLAQDWARVAKASEEAGEAIRALIACTGQNPRKGVHGTIGDLLNELSDVALTGILAIQHFTKDITTTQQVLSAKVELLARRVPVQDDAQ